MSRYLIVDDCDQNGRTYVRSWSLRKMRVSARWTKNLSEARVFEHRDVARLVANEVGGKARKDKRTKVYALDRAEHNKRVAEGRGSSASAELIKARARFKSINVEGRAYRG